MKLKETENFKLQYVNNIHTPTSQINNIVDSDTELAEKIIQILKNYEKNSNFKGKPSFKKWRNYCRSYGHSIAELRQKQKIIRTNHKNIENQINRFINTRKKTKNKNVHINNSSGKPLSDNYNTSTQQ